MRKVWLIEANPGVGYSLIPGDVMDLYRNKKLELDGKNNFNARLYNLMRICSKNNLTSNWIWRYVREIFLFISNF